MRRLFLFKSASGRWLGESPCLPGRYFLGMSREDVLERLRQQIQQRLNDLKEAHIPVREDEDELLIVGL